MSDDIEALLRSGMAERVDAAPVFDDPGLADAAIAGAGRIRRQRRVAAAASGAGLLVLGAATFVWQPWAMPDKEDGMMASDTSTNEAQRELDMEFVVETEDGTYEVINQDDAAVPIGDEEPVDVYRLTDAYLVEGANEVQTVGLDGSEGLTLEKARAEETRVQVNRAGEAFALITPSDDYEFEQFSMVDVSASALDPLAAEDASGDAGADAGGAAEPPTFTVDIGLSLVDWSAATTVFTADLTSITGGETGPYMFNEEYDWGLDSVAQAGFDAAVIADSSDPSYLCVADLEPGVGVTTTTEQCGPADSADVEEYLAVASGGASDSLAAAEQTLAWQESGAYPFDDADLGEHRTRFDNAEHWWTDPLNRWQLAASPGDRTWILVEMGEDGSTTVSELSPPNGSLMPVLSYT